MSIQDDGSVCDFPLKNSQKPEKQISFFTISMLKCIILNISPLMIKEGTLTSALIFITVSLFSYLSRVKCTELNS